MKKNTKSLNWQTSVCAAMLIALAASRYMGYISGDTFNLWAAAITSGGLFAAQDAQKPQSE